ncbi:hypothetical protein ACIOEW_14885 [Streptomyces sp. NPDC087901]|uniref:hypothetical protein n=1 Tax=Streptomyces sp. NPDC087901 TaxID=3365818 RepID=UPI00382197BA
MFRSHEKPEPDCVPGPAEDGEEGRPRSLWQEARRRVLLGVAGAAAPALLALLERWARR